MISEVDVMFLRQFLRKLSFVVVWVKCHQISLYLLTNSIVSLVLYLTNNDYTSHHIITVLNVEKLREPQKEYQ